MKMIGTKEAAERLGVGQQRVRVLLRTNRIKAVRMGRDWFIDEADLGKFVPRPGGRPRKGGRK